MIVLLRLVSSASSDTLWMAVMQTLKLISSNQMHYKQHKPGLVQVLLLLFYSAIWWLYVFLLNHIDMGINYTEKGLMRLQLHH